MLDVRVRLGLMGLPYRGLAQEPQSVASHLHSELYIRAAAAQGSPALAAAAMACLKWSGLEV